MRKQGGAALVIVVSLLAVSLTLGLMNMQSSQVDERLAGNYRAAAEAQMASEYGAAYGIQRLRSQLDYFDGHSSDTECDHLVDGLSSGGRESAGSWYSGVYIDAGVEVDVIGCQDDGRDLYLSWGQVKDGAGAIVAEAFVVFGYGGGGNGGPPVWIPL